MRTLIHAGRLLGGGTRKVFLNPIVVKELRQTVRSQYLVSIVYFCLFLQLLATGIHLSDTTSYDLSRGSGGALFGFLFGILAFITCVFVPVYVLVRLARERSGVNIDFLFVTTLSPGAIARGKFSSGLIISVMLFSLSMPFLAVTYFLRGVSLPSVFLALGLLFLVNALLIQASILLGSLFAPDRRPQKVMPWVLASAGSLVWVVFMLLEGGGWRPGVSGLPPRTAILAGLGLFTAVYSLLYACSVCLLMPGSTNRSLPVRVTVAVIWLLSGLLAHGYAFRKGVSSPGGAVMAWAVPHVILLALMAFWAVSEREEPSPRVRRAIPAGDLARLTAFPFFTGSANGVAWVLLFGGITFLCLFSGRAVTWRSAPAGGPEAIRLLVFFLHAVSYALIANHLRRTVLRDRVPYYQTWGLAVVLMGLVVGAALVEGFARKVSFASNSFEGLFFYSIGGVGMDESYLGPALTAAFGWFALAMMLNARWLLGGIAGFQRTQAPGETGPPPDGTAPGRPAEDHGPHPAEGAGSPAAAEIPGRPAGWRESAFGRIGP